MQIKKNNGFTFIELVIILLIIGILAAIAAPSFLSMRPNMRLKAAARGLYSNMQKAKLEAVKRNTNVVVLLNAVNCPALPTIPSLRGSYSVFVDDGSGAGGIANDQTQNGTEPTISSVTMPQNVALCLENFGGATGFTSQGFLIGNNIGSLTMSNSKNRSNTITLTIAGGVRIQ